MTVGASVRPRCFFDVEIGGLPMGRIVFELYSDLTPITCENFRGLCTGEHGVGKTSGKPLHYKGTVFHRVVRDFMIQSGDFTVGNGTGGESIYGGTFEDENLEHKHDKPYLLSMANRGKDTNGSQFFITTQPAPHLDGVHVVFGHVVSGKEVVSQIEVLPVDRNSRPLQDARISKCGELVLKSKAKEKKKKKHQEESPSSSSSSESVESSAEEAEGKKKKREGKAKKKSGAAASDDIKDKKAEDHVVEDVHPLVSVTKIDPNEIPEVPSNKFLYRGDGPIRDFRDGKDRDQRRGRDRDRGGRLDRGHFQHNREYRDDQMKGKTKGFTKSGRVIKGRGVFRFRTPSRSRSRSRSATPPHWKQAAKRTIKLSDFERLEAERKAKDEEIGRREEARKKRHEERQKEQKEHIQRLRQEAEQHLQRHQKDHTEGRSKPQSDRDGESTRPRKPAAADKKDPGVKDGPLDLNALDYESMDIAEADEEEPNYSALKFRKAAGIQDPQAPDGEDRRAKHNGVKQPRQGQHGEDRWDVRPTESKRRHRSRSSSRNRKNRTSGREKIKEEKRDKDRKEAEKLAESDDDLETEKERLRELEKLKQRMEQELEREMREKEKQKEEAKKKEKEERERQKDKDKEKEKEKERLKRKEEERKKEELRRREESRRKEEERKKREKEREAKQEKDRRDRDRRDKSRRDRSRSASGSDKEKKKKRRSSSESSGDRRKKHR